MEEKVWTKPEIVVLDVNEGTEGLKVPDGVEDGLGTYANS